MNNKVKQAFSLLSVLTCRVATCSIRVANLEENVYATRSWQKSLSNSEPQWLMAWTCDSCKSVSPFLLSLSVNPYAPPISDFLNITLDPLISISLLMMWTSDFFLISYFSIWIMPLLESVVTRDNCHIILACKTQQRLQFTSNTSTVLRRAALDKVYDILCHFS